MAPDANSFSLPIDVRRIDPASRGAPSSVTSPLTAKRSLRDRHPTNTVSDIAKSATSNCHRSDMCAGNDAGITSIFVLGFALSGQAHRRLFFGIRNAVFYRHRSYFKGSLIYLSISFQGRVGKIG